MSWVDEDGIEHIALSDEISPLNTTIHVALCSRCQAQFSRRTLALFGLDKLVDRWAIENIDSRPRLRSFATSLWVSPWLCPQISRPRQVGSWLGGARQGMERGGWQALGFEPPAPTPFAWDGLVWRPQGRADAAVYAGCLTDSELRRKLCPDLATILALGPLWAEHGTRQFVAVIEED